jgi:hypothetical protein
MKRAIQSMTQLTICGMMAIAPRSVSKSMLDVETPSYSTLPSVYMHRRRDSVSEDLPLPVRPTNDVCKHERLTEARIHTNPHALATFHVER